MGHTAHDKENQGIAAIRQKMPLARLAKEIGITRGAVSQWTRVPAERVVEIERITGIPREQLRPDIFQTAEQAP